MNKSTNTIFKSNKISFQTKENDYRYVKAHKAINETELILIEHCYMCKDINFMRNVILNSPELFNNLYPRKENWTEKIITEEGQTTDIMELVTEKAQKNMFGVGSNDYYLIGLDISKFNHSTAPNAYVKYRQCIIDENVSVVILYVISDKSIDIGEEITFSYGNNYFSENVNYNYNTEIKEANILVEKIMCQYLQKVLCIDIIINHICIYDGLYLINNDLICPTKRFMKTFDKEFTIENLEKWINDKKVYYTSIMCHPVASALSIRPKTGSGHAE